MYLDRPVPMPIIAAAGAGAGNGTTTVSGLDGTNVQATVTSTVKAMPGAPNSGVLMDLKYAEEAAEGNLSGAYDQVWVASGQTGRIVPKLRSEGVIISSTATVSSAKAAFRRAGPGLAQTLFLAEAAAGALLAAGGAVLALYLFARRRRYELAALAAVGVSRRSLVRAVLAEQLMILGYSLLAGIGAGVLAVVLALRDVPEFITTPPGVPLATFPPATTLISGLAIAVVLAGGAATAAGVRLVRGVDLGQLRESAG